MNIDFCIRIYSVMTTEICEYLFVFALSSYYNVCNMLLKHINYFKIKDLLATCYAM